MVTTSHLGAARLLRQNLGASVDPTTREVEEDAKAPTGDWLGATRRGIPGQLRSAVFVAHTSRTKSTGFGQRIGLTDTNRRRNGSYRRNQEAD
jgi:hypothetical protein